MNKQQKSHNRRGIEWTDFTWNVIGGCKHRCRWIMPDGTLAICYAEEIANGIAQANYPQGFESHYYHSDRLFEPLKLKKPARIFLDSMSDLMGYWVKAKEIDSILDICRQADWHTFQLLTKNAPRLLQFEYPPNVWVGISMPPSFMWGNALSARQQEAKFIRDLDVLSRIKVPVKWISFEPVSWNIAPILARFPGVISWAVIGAASSGRTYFQPDKQHIRNLLEVLSRHNVATFFKGNLIWSPWREEFPGL